MDNYKTEVFQIARDLLAKWYQLDRRLLTDEKEIDALNVEVMRIIARLNFLKRELEKGVVMGKREAVKAWNTRAEWTCRNVLGDGHFGCSVCGCHVRNLPLGSTYMSDGKRWYSTEKRAVNYCPHCGAKVVK